MKPLQVLIVEDDVLVNNDLQQYLKSKEFPVPIGVTSFEEAKKALLEKDIDLVLIDIHLGEKQKNGIELAEYIKRSNNLPVVFMTGNEDMFFDEAIKLQPAAFLLKPIRHKDLEYQLRLAYTNHFGEESDSVQVGNSIFLPTQNSVKKVDKNQVVYLQAKKSYTDVHVVGDSLPDRFSIHLGFLGQYFQEDKFIKISRSAIINAEFIQEIRTGTVVLKNGKKEIELAYSPNFDLYKRIKVIRRS